MIIISRRHFLALVGGVGLNAAGLTAQAAETVRRIGLLTTSTQISPREENLKQGLRDLGWIEGGNIVIEYRRAANNQVRLAEMAAELVALKVDVIVASSTPSVIAARNATKTIPIVTISADPVGNGFVKSLRHPGGNVTGISTISPVLSAKRLELLREINPKLSKVVFLGFGPDPTHKRFVFELEAAAKAFGMTLSVVIAESRADLDRALNQVAVTGAGALVIQPLFPIMGLAPQVLAVAEKLRLPTVTDSDGFAEAGGLLFYGHDPASVHQRLSVYVDRVLKGANPAELPVEQPQKFLLVVNRRTARTLGVRIPDSILARADKVID
ncbi:MAG: ABC transporter substrate-binding protein [Burkholderiales bacterium]|nr:ABC transporter substrate-binding protein [Burkholderiales bacterium]